VRGLGEVVEKHVQNPADPEVFFDILNGGPIRFAAARKVSRREASLAAMTF